jgi:hypothetical protein
MNIERPTRTRDQGSRRREERSWPKSGAPDGGTSDPAARTNDFGRNSLIPRQGPVIPRQGSTILAEKRWSRGKDQWSRGRDQRFWRKFVGPDGGNADPAAGSGDFGGETAVLEPRRPSPGERTHRGGECCGANHSV